MDAIRRRKTSNHRFQICGIGRINNKGQKPTGLRCIFVDVPPIEKCDPQPPRGSFCIKYPEIDTNVCAGDAGGALYLVEVDERGRIKPKTREVLSIINGNPNVPRNGQCQGGGDITFSTFVAGPPTQGSSINSWFLQVAGSPLFVLSIFTFLSRTFCSRDLANFSYERSLKNNANLSFLVRHQHPLQQLQQLSAQQSQQTQTQSQVRLICFISLK